VTQVQGAKGGGQEQRTPRTAKDNLASTSYYSVVDAIGEGEIQGFATPEKNGISKADPAYNVQMLKDIYVNNTPVLRSNATVQTGSYVQTATDITVTCNGHGYTNGTNLVLTIGSGLATSGSYKITAVTASTFTAASKNTNVTFGNVAMVKGVDLNFKDIEVYSRYGTASQLAVSGFDRVENEQGVNTVVEFDAPIIRTITNTSVDAVRIAITVPQLQRFEVNGDVLGSSFKLQMQLSEDGGGFYTAIEDTITGRTADTYQRDYEISLVGKSFPVDVRVVRITADSASSRVVNAFTWTSYTEIVDGRLSYPNTALVASRASSEQFDSIPTRSFKVRGLKVVIPSNATVDLATGALLYSGVWDGTFGAAAWTSDPAWCLWNLLTNYRYGFGDQLNAAQLDKWAFYSASRYCSALDTYLIDGRTGTTNDYNATTGRHGIPNGFGGYEPRFSCNTNIQTQEEAYKLINDLCSVFRVMPYWATGTLTISQDAPADPSYLFTLANVSEGGFNYTASSQKTKPSVVLVSYLDMDTRESAYEQVEDRGAVKRFGIVTQEVSAFACTSRSQARRLGEWILYSNNYEAEVVSFTASIEAGVAVRPGQIINIADPMKAGSRRGGRIKSATTTTITVDDATGLPASGGTLSVILPTGLVETKTVSSRAGAVITVASAFSLEPNSNSIWVYENATIEASTWRVLSVTERDQCEYEINAIAHNASKYDYIERDQELEIRDITDLNERPDPPINLVLTEALYTYQSEVRAKVIANWKGVEGAASYRIRWRRTEDNWREDIVYAPSYEILNITPGGFEIEVYSVTGVGIFSNEPTTGTITALGKTVPPSNVTGLTYTIDKNLGAVLSWNAIADIDLDTYEIRRGASFDLGTLITQVNATTYKLGYLDDGTYEYHIKAIDTSGIYSVTAATVTVVVAPPGSTTITTTIEGTLAILKWTVPSVTTYEIDSYIIKAGDVYSSALTLAQIKSTTFTAPIDWIGQKTFWVAPVDIVGRLASAPDNDIVVVSAADAPTITRTVTGNNAVLSWTAVAGTLPTAEYEIRQGANYINATVITKLTGLIYSFKADWTGAQTYWVAAIDVNGNYGTAASVAVSVNTAAAPSTSTVFSGENVVFSWNAVKGSLETEFYRLKRGATYATATLVADIKGTAYTLKVDWGATQRFWLAAVDINGAEGNAGSTDVVITLPVAPSITQQVIDNNVLLRWNDVTQTLPIQSYELRRGATYAGATVIGTKQGKFTSVFETAAGTYTYWLAGIDSAGNYGAPGSIAAIVSQPPDYILQSDFNSTWAGTETNIYTDSQLGQVVNVNTTETWQSHFTSRGWTSPQSQINAGYSYFLMPSTTTASYVEEIDFGAVIPTSKVSATLTSTIISGNTTITPTLEVRNSTASPWTTYSGVYEAYATQFRYVRVTFNFASAGGDDLLVLGALNIRLDNKIRNDAGSGYANAGDQYGTTVNFTYPFIDIHSISVTPATTNAVIAVYDFADIPNPSTFKVYLYDTNGTRVNGNFSWGARGV